MERSEEGVVKVNTHTRQTKEKEEVRRDKRRRTTDRKSKRRQKETKI